MERKKSFARGAGDGELAGARERIKKYLPEGILVYHRQYHRWKTERRYLKSIRTSLRQIVEKGGYLVQGGIFRGMRHIGVATGSVLTPKLIGSYEEELHDVFRFIFGQPYEVIVDIGCAEGYYTVGLARCFPQVRVYAFDSNRRARKLTAQMARLNRVEDRVVIFGACSQEDLKRIAGRHRTFILCDCDGYEMELLQPECVEGLRYCDILVELHEHLIPNAAEVMTRRFEATHGITRICQAERDPGNYPVLEGLDLEDRLAALAEWRPPGQQWLFLRSKNLPGA